MPPKRPAAGAANTQPPRKKQHVEKPKSLKASRKTLISTKKSADREEKAAPPKPKRKAPITSNVPLKNESDTDEDEGDEFDEMSEASDDDDEEIKDEDSMDEDGAETKPKKKKKVTPKTPAESHALQREKAKERRLARPNGEMIVEAKKHWELARQHNLSKEERQKHVNNLMENVKGKVKDVVTKHDASRVIQTLVKYGSQSQRNTVARELQGAYRDLIQSRYSRHLVLKLIRCCPTLRSEIFSEFHGHVIRLLLHRDATEIISSAFTDYASPQERNLLIRDFYGKEVALFDSETLKAGGLKAVMDDADETRKGRILSALKSSLTRIFDNPDKGAVGHPVVHRALWEYLQEVLRLPTPDEQVKARNEMFENCHELLAEMAHTKDGSRAVREFVAWGSAKDRKKILKTFKPHLERMCLDDQAQLVLFTCLDAIDDTKALVSTVVNDVVSLAPKLVLPPSSTDSTTDLASGRRSLFYLLLPRDPRYFTPALTRTIAETDAIVAQTSKKDAEVRKKEILAGASEGLLKFVTSEAEKLVRDPAGSLVATDVVLHAEGDRSSATKALLRPLVDSPFPSPSSTSHPIDLAHSSRLYKNLLQGGRFSQKSNSVVTVPSYSAIDFARSMLADVGKEKLLTMATEGGGAFVLTELVERFIQEGSGEEKKELKAWVGSKAATKKIEESSAKGKDALLSKVNELRSLV
ncbi:pumilio domain member 6 [Tulasnella sp. 424]|nr:pumilio domain member 6 [Tulasnella sp. 424]KAG8967529.1 pumilio domain member 6 [Tulasnella sp. 425]